MACQDGGFIRSHRIPLRLRAVLRGELRGAVRVRACLSCRCAGGVLDTVYRALRTMALLYVGVSSLTDHKSPIKSGALVAFHGFLRWTVPFWRKRARANGLRGMALRPCDGKTFGHLPLHSAPSGLRFPRGNVVCFQHSARALEKAIRQRVRTAQPSPEAETTRRGASKAAVSLDPYHAGAEKSRRFRDSHSSGQWTSIRCMACSYASRSSSVQV